MSTKTKTFTILAFVFVVVCLASLILSFASDRWVVSTEKEVSGFKNLGLWSACFSRYRPPAWALVDKYYDGCWWVFDREMDDLRQFLFPPWFRATQVMVTMGLTFQLLAIIIMIVNAINCFPYNRFKHLISTGLAIASTVLHGLTAILLIVAVIMFGARADNERTWLEKPDQNYLSWSFGLCVLAAFISILSFMTAFVESYRLRLSHGDGSEPQAFLTTIPPLATSYAYSKQKFQPSYDEKSVQDKPQPAYANRYSNQGSQLSVRAKPPNTIFAVNGSGEVYFNRAYVNDEDTQKGRTNGYVPPPERRQVNPQTYQGRQPLYTRGDAGNADTPHTAHKPTDSNNVPSKKSQNTNNDYKDSKTIKQPVLPEYVPKSKTENVKKIDIDNTLNESCDTDVTKTKKDRESRERKSTRSNSKNKKSTRSRSSSEKQNKKHKAGTDDDKGSDVGHSRHRSKTQDNRSNDSEEEHSRSRNRSKKRTSQRKSRKSSRSREKSSSRRKSHSRDINSSDSESSANSDSASVASRARQKHRGDQKSSSTTRRHRSASKDSTRKEKHSTNEAKKRRDGGHTDDNSGSEYSSKHRSKSIGDQVETGWKTKTKQRDYSDTESIRSKQRSKSKGEHAEPDGKRRGKLRDFPDTESVRSKQSRRSDHKPKGTYSSYYEY